MFGQRAVQFMGEIFKEAGVSPKRVVLLYANDLFGQVQARSFQAAHKAASPAWDIVEVIPWPEPPADLSTEVSRLKAAKPDIIAPITRPASALLLLPEIERQRVEAMGIIEPGQPRPLRGGPDRQAQGADRVRHGQRALAELQEPAGPGRWPRSTRSGRRRGQSQGKTFDTNSVFSYDGMLLIADVLERAGAMASGSTSGTRMPSWTPSRRRQFTGGLAVSAGPSCSTRSATTPTRPPP